MRNYEWALPFESTCHPRRDMVVRSRASATTHESAIVLIPPQEVWEPIQAIRRVHDRQVRRWMPHVTLLYPFLPGAALAGALAVAERALAAVASHSGKRSTSAA